MDRIESTTSALAEVPQAGPEKVSQIVPQTVSQTGAQPEAVKSSKSKRRPGMKTAVGTAVAAAALAAVTVFSGTSASADPASILGSPANSASSRIAGVQADMARAVALQQVTPEQAAFLERQLVRRIQGNA